MTKTRNIPVVVGVAQYTQPKDVSNPLDPLGLMVKTAKMAMKDTKSTQISHIIDSIYMSNIISWTYRDAPQELGDALGLKLKEKHYLPIGGNTPQYSLNKAAEAIERGEIQGALLVGGEANYSTYKAKKGKIEIDWPNRQKPEYVDDTQPLGFNSFIQKYNLLTFPNGYALMETALRAKLGLTVGEYQDKIGKILADFSSVAKNNPYAWTQKEYSKDEIIEPSPKNRLVNHPYTKRMVSNLYVDMSAAVLLTSEDVASRLNVPSKKWVYPMGGANMMNVKYMLQRPYLFRSPAINHATELSLKQADLSLNDIDVFDLYSCFACMIQIARREIGIPENDPRPLTLTGGLPYFGGPFNNYSMHGIVEAIEYVRKNPKNKALVQANGGYNTKQSVGIYGKEPGKFAWNNHNELKERQKSINKTELPEPIEKANGDFAIKGYTVIYNREGTPSNGLLICENQSQQRTYAFAKPNKIDLDQLVNKEYVGKTCELRYNKEKKLNHCEKLK